MKKLLRFSDDLRLPALEAQTQTLIVYGGKGMGKTNFGAVLCEELHRCDLRFAYIDPLGVQWGLKHSADGRGPGIPLLILGGLHADLPLEPTGGELVADLVVDEDVDVLIDISRRASGRMWSQGERIRFVTAYCNRLFERQGERRRPRMQIIDECGRFAPEQAAKGEDQIMACIGAIEMLTEWGRNVGVGVTLITQRSARMRKSVSELADVMVAFRTVGPRSIGAIIDWFGEHVPRDRQHVLVEQLRELERGTALVVSPGWLRLEGQFPVRLRETFDSSATPESGRERRASGKGAQIDRERFEQRMAETIERARAEDPRALQKRIRELQAELAKAREEQRPAEPQVETIEVPVPFIPPEIVRGLEPVYEALARIQADAATGHGGIDALREMIRNFKPEAVAPRSDSRAKERVQTVAARPRPSAGGGPRGRATNGSGRAPLSLPAGGGNAVDADGARTQSASSSAVQEKILRALGWLAAVGIDPATRLQVALVAGYHPRTGGFLKALADLNETGRVFYPQPTMVALAFAEDRVAFAPEAAPTEEALREMIYQQVGNGAKFLQAILAEHPISREELAERLGYHPRTGGFLKELGRLKKLGVIEFPRAGYLAPSDVLYLSAR